MADIKDPNSHHVKMAQSMAEATNWILAGRASDASMHVKAAQFHHDNHVKMLKDQGRSGEADVFVKAMRPYISEMNNLFNRVNQGKPLVDSTKKSEQPADNLDKAIPQNLGFNPKRNYKMFHELSHEEKLSAGNAYQNKDLHSHMYAFDKKTNEFNSFGRIKIPKNPTVGHPAHGKKPYYPTPGEQGSDSPVQTHHLRDSFVRIHSPGSDFHGKPGIVQGYAPQHPGKIPVQVNHKGMVSTQFFHPHEVISGKSSTKKLGEK